jgi:hypothetical protein
MRLWLLRYGSEEDFSWEVPFVTLTVNSSGEGKL